MKTHKEVAAAFVIASDATWEDRQEHHVDDWDMLDMFAGDHTDEITCALYIREGKIKDLHKKLSRMDTAAREDVGYAVHAICPAYFKKHFEPHGWKCLD